MQKIVFLDRDGVINIEKNYLYKIEDFEFIDGIFEACRYFISKGFKIIIVTNQSGIGRGYYTSKDFDTLTTWMLDEFKKQNIIIEYIQYCPHTPEDNCNCRKPKTGLIDNINNKLQIDFQNSWLIGDKESDIELAINAGISNSILVETGHKTAKNSKAKYRLKSLKDINLILRP